MASYGYNPVLNRQLFRCYSQTWEMRLDAHINLKPEDYMDYQFNFSLKELQHAIQGIRDLLISRVTMRPTRYDFAPDVPDGPLSRDDFKGSDLDTNKWFHRKAIPPLEFRTSFYDGVYRTTFAKAFYDSPPITPGQSDWINKEIVACLDMMFEFSTREAFLVVAKANLLNKLKDGISAGAMSRMASFRRMVEGMDEIEFDPAFTIEGGGT